MGKKKRGHPDVEELLSRPWCYYCERDFEDLKLLISHQKAKHFKCDRCGKRLNTAGGLSVHMNQVHKENLSSVENALPNRQGLDIEIFGMEGVPEDIVQQHNQRIIQNFYTAQAERHAATGNPPPGQNGGQGPTKKLKIETPDEIKKRLAEHRARLAAHKTHPTPGMNGSNGATPIESQSPGHGNSPFAPPQAGLPYPSAGVPGASFSPAQAFPPSFPPGASPPAGASPFNLPARPPSGAAAATNLPQRPPYGAPGAFYNGAAPTGTASTVDELVSGAAAAQQAHGDDIDHIIRMAEAGIRPAPGKGAAADEAGGTTEKKGKKDKEKNVRMVYADLEISPEEKLAMMPRYAFVPEPMEA